MSVYVGPWRRSWFTGFFWRTVCMTGWQANLFRGELVGVYALEGAATGFLIGLFISFLGIASTSELPPLTLLSLAVGASLTVVLTAIGAAVGIIIGLIVSGMANCSPCGICFEMAFRQIGGKMIPVIPIVILPRTVDCPLIPPGCP